MTITFTVDMDNAAERQQAIAFLSQGEPVTQERRHQIYVTATQARQMLAYEHPEWHGLLKPGRTSEAQKAQFRVDHPELRVIGW